MKTFPQTYQNVIFFNKISEIFTILPIKLKFPNNIWLFSHSSPPGTVVSTAMAVNDYWGGAKWGAENNLGGANVAATVGLCYD